MGLFTNKKNPCPICGNPTPRLFPLTIEGQPLCGDCKDKIDLPNGTDGVMLEDIRQYLAFHNENKPLRDMFKATFKFNFVGSAWNDVLILDMEHRLFRIRDKGDALALEPANLKAFRIREDDQILFESTPEGLKCYETDTLEQARALQPEFDRYNAEMDRYRQTKYMYEMIEEREKRENIQPRTITPFISEPTLNITFPFEKFYVELTLDHPYWGGERTYEEGHPDCGLVTPELGKFLRGYEKRIGDLHDLASHLMTLIDPDAPEINIPLPASVDTATQSRSMPVSDPVAEIQKYKTLLDNGVITEDEFTAKKRQLLGI